MPDLQLQSFAGKMNQDTERKKETWTRSSLRRRSP